MIFALFASAVAAVPAPASRLAPFSLERPAAFTYVLAPEAVAGHPWLGGPALDAATITDPGSAAGTPGPTTLSVSMQDVYSRKYGRHMGLANAGLITLGAGAGVSTLGAVGLVAGVVQGNEGTILLGTLAVVLGSVGSYAGQVIFSIGGLEAAYDLQRLGRPAPVLAGWIGCGMMAGGAAVSLLGGTFADTTGSSTDLSAFTVVSGVLTAGALIPSAVTYVVDRKNGVDLRASLAPTLMPMRLADGSVETIPGLGVSATW